MEPHFYADNGCILFYFPDNEKLREVVVCGPVPRQGELVWIFNNNKSVPPYVDFRQRSYWRVRRVIWLVQPAETLDARFKNQTFYQAKVLLVRQRSWFAAGVAIGVALLDRFQSWLLPMAGRQ